MKTSYLVVVEHGDKLPTEVVAATRTFYSHELDTCTRKSALSDPGHNCNNGDKVLTYQATVAQAYEQAGGMPEETPGSITIYKVGAEVKAPVNAEVMESAQELTDLLTE